MEEMFQALNISFATAFGVALLLLSVSEMLGLVESPPANGLLHALLMLFGSKNANTDGMDVPELQRRLSIHGSRPTTPQPSIYSLHEAQLYDSHISDATTVLARTSFPSRPTTPQ